jgi:hypothetical protein
MELMIESFEGGFYLAFERINNSRKLVLDTDNQPVRFNSLEQAHAYFRDSAPTSAWLVHNSAYDEMIGCQVNDDHELRIPLNW